ncbi:hypothetical protein ACGFZJ_31055 [Streptomyces sp. NPDC048253]|uniref:hypothetical protein n=1 Tax=Streptomyces sp. NPDC048253 TaxID=3365524 RepID=UPI003719015D
MTVLVALALSASSDPVLLLQAALTGIGVGIFSWAVCRLARSQHAYYERVGRFGGAGQQAPLATAETMSPQMHVLLFVGGWVVLSGVFWLISPLIDMPRSVPWSAFFGALLLGAAIMVEWIKRERS